MFGYSRMRWSKVGFNSEEYVFLEEDFNNWVNKIDTIISRISNEEERASLVFFQDNQILEKFKAASNFGKTAALINEKMIDFDQKQVSIQ